MNTELHKERKIRKTCEQILIKTIKCNWKIQQNEAVHITQRKSKEFHVILVIRNNRIAFTSLVHSFPKYGRNQSKSYFRRFIIIILLTKDVYIL